MATNYDKLMPTEERHELFEWLCTDPTYPCQRCTLRKDVERCGRTDGCPEWLAWFERTWRELRKELKEINGK